MNEYIQCLEGNHIWACETRNAHPAYDQWQMHHTTVRCLRCGAVR